MMTDPLTDSVYEVAQAAYNSGVADERERIRQLALQESSRADSEYRDVAGAALAAFARLLTAEAERRIYLQRRERP